MSMSKSKTMSGPKSCWASASVLRNARFQHHVVFWGTFYIHGWREGTFCEEYYHLCHQQDRQMATSPFNNQGYVIFWSEPVNLTWQMFSLIPSGTGRWLPRSCRCLELGAVYILVLYSMAASMLCVLSSSHHLHLSTLTLPSVIPSKRLR